MPERPFPSIPRPTTAVGSSGTPAPAQEAAIDERALRELTPRALFTNLFQVTLPRGALGQVQSAKADKEEFEGRRRPAFYQTGNTLYCYGSGQDEFNDRRFSPAIVTPETDRSFTKFLLARGLMDFFRGLDFRLRGNAQGFAVQDHKQLIRSSEKGHLHIVPQYNFQPYWIESTDGRVRFAFSVEPGTTTLPTFHIHEGLRRAEGALLDLELVLTEEGCRPGCPLHGRLGQRLGRFRGFAAAGEPLDCTCHIESFDAVAITVVDRQRKPGVSRRRRGGRGRNKSDYIETSIVIPGQLVTAAPSQSRLLRLSNDHAQLELAGKVWLGQVSADRRIRANALHVRYERIQQFLARMAGHPTGPLVFTLPTGSEARLDRVPVTVEELASGGDGVQSPYADAE